mgnify:FL=1
MAATFTWDISQVDRQVSSGLITNIHWRLSAVKTINGTEYTADCYGSKGVSGDPSSSDFIAYDSVTKDNAIAWVKAALDADEDEDSAADKEAGLQGQINKKATPVDASGVPW